MENTEISVTRGPRCYYVTWRDASGRTQDREFASFVDARAFMRSLKDA